MHLLSNIKLKGVCDYYKCSMLINNYSSVCVVNVMCSCNNIRLNLSKGPYDGKNEYEMYGHI